MQGDRCALMGHVDAVLEDYIAVVAFLPEHLAEAHLDRHGVLDLMGQLTGPVDRQLHVLTVDDADDVGAWRVVDAYLTVVDYDQNLAAHSLRIIR